MHWWLEIPLGEKTLRSLVVHALSLIHGRQMIDTPRGTDLPL
jgi:hypothetical protein